MRNFNSSDGRIKNVDENVHEISHIFMKNINHTRIDMFRRSRMECASHTRQGEGDVTVSPSTPERDSKQPRIRILLFAGHAASKTNDQWNTCYVNAVVTTDGGFEIHLFFHLRTARLSTIQYKCLGSTGRKIQLPGPMTLSPDKYYYLAQGRTTGPLPIGGVFRGRFGGIVQVRWLLGANRWRLLGFNRFRY